MDTPGRPSQKQAVLELVRAYLPAPFDRFFVFPTYYVGCERILYVLLIAYVFAMTQARCASILIYVVDWADASCIEYAHSELRVLASQQQLSRKWVAGCTFTSLCFEPLFHSFLSSG